MSQTLDADETKLAPPVRTRKGTNEGFLSDAVVRSRVVLEILSTERDYVKNLQDVVEVRESLVLNTRDLRKGKITVQLKKIIIRELTIPCAQPCIFFSYDFSRFIPATGTACMFSLACLLVWCFVAGDVFLAFHTDSAFSYLAMGKCFSSLNTTTKV